MADAKHLTKREGVLISSMTLARYVLNSMTFWALSEALGLGIDLWTFILVGAVVQLSLVVAFTPEGLGIMDLGWLGLLALGGTATDTVAAFIIDQRAFQYTFFPIMAGVSSIMAGRRNRANSMVAGSS